MKLSVLGLGYVGCVSAACFAKRGHEVVGADVSPVKVDIINAGKSPIVEPGIDALIAEAVSDGKLRATTDAAEAVMQTDVSLVCVGTPGQHNGSLDLTYVKRVCQQIGAAIEKKPTRHVVAMRSTMLPGTIQEVVIPTLQVYSGKTAGKDFGVVINPEFLREGTSLYDFDHPPFTLIGADDEETAETVKRLYAHIDAPLYVTRVKEAEMVKYACNAFHAAKIVFANLPTTCTIRASDVQERRDSDGEMLPPTICPVGLGSSAMIACAVTDLPDPDSPTNASVSPCATSKLTRSSARTTPAEVENSTARSRTDSSGTLTGTGVA